MSMTQIIMRRMTRPFAAAAVAVALLAARQTGAAEATDRFTRTLPYSPSRGLRIDATIADVTIVGSDRDDIAVEVVRRAPASADLAAYPVRIDDGANVLHVDVTQAAEGRNAALKTEIVVRAPSSARIGAVRVFEGRVRLERLTTGCDVDVRRGPIEATDVGGRIRLESGIGRIDVRNAALTPGGMMHLRVFNGPAAVRFARAPSDGRILAVTFNGTITSDIPLAMKDKFGPRFGEATLGSGEPVLSIDVVTGDISILIEKR
jgi:hypothetical protein